MFCLQQKQKTQNVQQENKLFLVHADTVEDFARSFENTSFSNAKANPNHKKNLLPIYRTVRSAYLRMLVPTCPDRLAFGSRSLNLVERNIDYSAQHVRSAERKKLLCSLNRFECRLTSPFDWQRAPHFCESFNSTRPQQQWQRVCSFGRKSHN
ncbi:uncharacterized protein LOC110118021 [Ceratitis capitata]|uniref:uncharacterized protein LOC110118021 n=1 Tax=Ceratitis capitata TaxID=7213 RepID=UPI000A101F3E|nr:uncharacterized protein LOC110118021 [Ceratitis capitata]